MKRVYDNGFRHCSNAVANVEANQAKLQYQILLEEFLVLQKEFVSRKRKLQSAKQKREILFAELKFLRRRHKYLLRKHSFEAEPEKDFVHCQNLEAERRCMVQGERSNEPTRAAFDGSCSVSVSDSDMGNEERQRGGALFVRKKRRLANMPENYLIEDEQLGKKKIPPCHNQLTLKV